MKNMPRISSVIALALVAMAAGGLLVTGCSSTPVVQVAHETERQQRQVEARAGAPYYGTGVVVHAMSRDLVVLTFEGSPLPANFAKLIVVRGSGVVAKVRLQLRQTDNKYLGDVLEGTPKEGDFALGWQREAEFSPPSPPSPWRKLP